MFHFSGRRKEEEGERSEICSGVAHLNKKVVIFPHFQFLTFEMVRY
ncbi:MAG: hypothetical protein F6K17_31605 [Okeania sp. SIO3C4]|nr:hypothetical protein [Okeania sp. SIO3C4]